MCMHVVCQSINLARDDYFRHCLGPTHARSDWPCSIKCTQVTKLCDRSEWLWPHQSWWKTMMNASNLSFLSQTLSELQHFFWVCAKLAPNQKSRQHDICSWEYWTIEQLFTIIDARTSAGTIVDIQTSWSECSMTNIQPSLNVFYL